MRRSIDVQIRAAVSHPHRGTRCDASRDRTEPGQSLVAGQVVLSARCGAVRPGILPFERGVLVSTRDHDGVPAVGY